MGRPAGPKAPRAYTQNGAYYLCFSEMKCILVDRSGFHRFGGLR
jgi:hypothetical protein